jgi:hypothetical protein
MATGHGDLQRVSGASMDMMFSHPSDHGAVAKWIDAAAQLLLTTLRSIHTPRRIIDAFH